MTLINVKKEYLDEVEPLMDGDILLTLGYYADENMPSKDVTDMYRRYLITHQARYHEKFERWKIKRKKQRGCYYYRYRYGHIPKDGAYPDWFYCHKTLLGTKRSMHSLSLIHI